MRRVNRSTYSLHSSRKKRSKSRSAYSSNNEIKILNKKLEAYKLKLKRSKDEIFSLKDSNRTL